MTTFNRGWLVTYTLLCAGLMLGGFASGQVSDFSMRVIGGTDCDSQSKLTSTGCKPHGGYETLCTQNINVCNQNPGNGTKICQSQGGGAACSSQYCVSTSHDSLSKKDAAGDDCTPVQLSDD